MLNKPSNTREQCAFDSGETYGRRHAASGFLRWCREENPHKKGSADQKFWNAGFDSVVSA